MHQPIRLLIDTANILDQPGLPTSSGDFDRIFDASVVGLAGPLSVVRLQPLFLPVSVRATFNPINLLSIQESDHQSVESALDPSDHSSSESVQVKSQSLHQHRPLCT
ncbi:hypothetical protein PGT21_010136 [Puccinia graminis f. sp. tritici]|uniref:Uncharacterized protein n=1 Tax=Puccinia graminis f. sp. tritici TaxID=56615 RepID=A0A5B0LVU0_PUCGR|nr:hypothetical protein PGT21_010136 [Puccinia graminis f. sp. tritici]